MEGGAKSDWNLWPMYFSGSGKQAPENGNHRHVNQFSPVLLPRLCRHAVGAGARRMLIAAGLLKGAPEFQGGKGGFQFE